jgi:tetratricopeptide (TPR) repeat protein
MQRHDEALARFNRAIELDPGDALANAARGLVYRYRDMKRYDEALADLNRAVELNPGDARAIAERSETRRLMQRYD